jgi:hypothetical protein
MTDQLIDAAMARGLHADACRDHALVAWIIMRDPPEYPDKFIARLATDRPSWPRPNSRVTRGHFGQEAGVAW